MLMNNCMTFNKCLHLLFAFVMHTCLQLIRFARVSSHVVDFNARNKSLTAKLKI